MKVKVFISYGKEDFKAAMRLHNDLQQAGFEPWIDKENLRGGQKWHSTISQAIKNARYFITLLSTTSVNKKGFVNREILEALDILKEYPEDEVYIIPVRLDECQPAHSALKDLHWLNLFPEWDDGFRDILKSMGYYEEKKSSMPFKAFIQVRLNSKELERENIKKLIVSIPRITQADFIFGHYDLSLTLEAATHKEFQSSLERLIGSPLVKKADISISAGST